MLKKKIIFWITRLVCVIHVWSMVVLTAVSLISVLNVMKVKISSSIIVNVNYALLRVVLTVVIWLTVLNVTLKITFSLIIILALSVKLLFASNVQARRSVRNVNKEKLFMRRHACHNKFIYSLFCWYLWHWSIH